MALLIIFLPVAFLIMAALGIVILLSINAGTEAK